MPASSLEQKTIRPGSLGTYSYYHSNRLPARPAAPVYTAARGAGSLPRPGTKVIAAGLAVAVVVGLFTMFSGGSSDKKTGAPVAATPSATQAAPVASAAAPSTANQCAGNTLAHFVRVSVSQRHLWACEQTKLVHETAVITGMLAHDSTHTPPGTYKIYAKTTNTTLSGADETGSWSRPVYYWLPFLDNKHGTYGFHDATWRADTDFGKISPDSTDASHGCVELPLASMKWLYEWAPDHTALTVES